MGKYLDRFVSAVSEPKTPTPPASCDDAEPPALNRSFVLKILGSEIRRALLTDESFEIRFQDSRVDISGLSLDATGQLADHQKIVRAEFLRARKEAEAIIQSCRTKREYLFESGKFVSACTSKRGDDFQFGYLVLAVFRSLSPIFPEPD